MIKRFLALALLASAAACHNDSTSPGDPSLVAGAWTGTTSFYTQIRLRMTERMDDSVLVGNWAGDRGSCTGLRPVCTDSGIVIAGGRVGHGYSFKLTAINATRSLQVDGSMSPDSVITAISALTDNGAHPKSEPLTLRRH